MVPVDLDAAGLRLHAPVGQRFSVGLPVDWAVHLDPHPDVPLIGVAPEADGWDFRTNIVVTVERLDDGMTLESWQASADDVLPRSLTDYQLLDLQQVEIGERAGIRRLAHHDSGGRAVTMEQWTLVDAGCGFTLTASAATLMYPAVADGLAVIGQTLRVADHLTADQSASDA